MQIELNKRDSQAKIGKENAVSNYAIHDSRLSRTSGSPQYYQNKDFEFN